MLYKSSIKVLLLLYIYRSLLKYLITWELLT